jgi:hypothetical protein
MTRDPSRSSAKGEIAAARSLGFSSCRQVISEERYCLGKAKCFASEDDMERRRGFLESVAPTSKALHAIFWWLISGASERFPAANHRLSGLELR